MNLNKKYTTLGVLLVASLFLLASCGAGLSVEEAEEIKNDVQDISGRIGDIESSLAQIHEADSDEVADVAATTVDDVIQELNQIASRLDEIESRLEVPEPVEEEPMDPGGEPQPGF